MATGTEDFDTIASIIKREIQRRKKQHKKPKDELINCIPISNSSTEDETELILFKKKKKKKNGDKKMVQKDKFLKNDKATLKVEQFRNETCDDNVKYLNKINISASNLNKSLTTRIQIANASKDDEALTLLKSPLKKSKKKKKKSKMTIKEDTESSKYKYIQKNLKNMEDLKKYISEEESNEIHNDPAMINSPYNSTILKVHEEEYPDLFQKLFKNKKKDKEKSIKAVPSKELVSPKKLNKRKQQTTDKEYSKNDSLQSVVMDVETYYDSNYSIDDDGEKNSELFDTLDDYTSEYRTMTNTGQYCNQTSNNANGVHSHEIVHTGNTPLQCDVCFKTFSYKSKLHRHKRTHTGEKPYSCDVCGRSFTQQAHLVTHKRMHTDEKPYSCNVCCQSFSHKSTLLSHTITHTGEKPYACDVCGNSFSQKSTLVVHKRTHTGEKLYACNVCGRSFSEQGGLVRHKRTHTGEKPYACDVCGNSFSVQGNLVVHKRTHTEEKPYVCNVCGLSFSEQGSLVRHKKTHSGEKPYACNVCGRPFSRKSTLVVHFRIHSGERPYECGQCEKKFSTSSDRIKHTRRVHIKCF